MECCIWACITGFKIRIITTPSMSKHPRIFTQPPPCSPLTSSTTSSLLVLDPFNSNYTLTGLVTHIDSSLGELIASKTTSGAELEQGRGCQVMALTKIRDEVQVLKNIITYNLDQILNHLYQPSHKPQEDTRTNHSSSHRTAQGDQPLDPSLAFLDFQADQRHLSRPHRSQQLSIQAPDSSSSPPLDTVGSQPQPNRLHQEGLQQNKRFDRTVTPFELEELSAGKMRIEDGEEDEEDELFDLVCYEKDLSFSSNRGIKRQNAREQTFSPILERAPEEEETLEKKRSTIEKGQEQITPRFQQTLSKKLFNYTAPILPRRVHHKKYNYLEQLSERHH